MNYSSFDIVDESIWYLGTYTRSYIYGNLKLIAIELNSELFLDAYFPRISVVCSYLYVELSSWQLKIDLNLGKLRIILPGIFPMNVYGMLPSMLEVIFIAIHN